MAKTFDPLKHHRDTRGRFAEMLNGLSRGDSVHLGGDVHVLKDGKSESFTVRHAGGVASHGDAKGAADAALEASARSAHPDSLGGARSHKDLPSALKTNRAKARRAGKNSTPKDTAPPTRLPSSKTATEPTDREKLRAASRKAGVSNRSELDDWLGKVARDPNHPVHAEARRYLTGRDEANKAANKPTSGEKRHVHFVDSKGNVHTRRTAANYTHAVAYPHDYQGVSYHTSKAAADKMAKRGNGTVHPVQEGKATQTGSIPKKQWDQSVVPEADSARAKTLKATGRRDVPQAQLNKESNDLVQQAGQHAATIAALSNGDTAHFNHETSVSKQNGTYHVTGHNGRTAKTKDIHEAVIQTQKKQGAAMEAKGIRPHGHGNPKQDWREPTVADHQSLLRVEKAQREAEKPPAQQVAAAHIKADTVKLPPGVSVTNSGKDNSTVTVDGKVYKLTQIRKGKQGEHYQWQTADGEPLARNHSDALWALTNVGQSNVILSQQPDRAAAELRGPGKGPRAPKFDPKTGRRDVRDAEHSRDQSVEKARQGLQGKVSSADMAANEKAQRTVLERRVKALKAGESIDAGHGVTVHHEQFTENRDKPLSMYTVKGGNAEEDFGHVVDHPDAAKRVAQVARERGVGAQSNAPDGPVEPAKPFPTSHTRAQWKELTPAQRDEANRLMKSQDLTASAAIRRVKSQPNAPQKSTATQSSKGEVAKVKISKQRGASGVNYEKLEINGQEIARRQIGIKGGNMTGFAAKIKESEGPYRVEQENRHGVSMHVVKDANGKEIYAQQGLVRGGRGQAETLARKLNTAFGHGTRARSGGPTPAERAADTYLKSKREQSARG